MSRLEGAFRIPALMWPSMVQGERERERETETKCEKEIYTTKERRGNKRNQICFTICPRGLVHICRVCRYIQLGTTSWTYSAKELAREREQKKRDIKDIKDMCIVCT